MYRKIIEEMASSTVSTEEIIRWHYITRPVSCVMLVDLEEMVTPEKEPQSVQKQSSGTTNETDDVDDYENYGNLDSYGAIVCDSWETPAKTTSGLGRSTKMTPPTLPPGLHPEDLNLWGSGVKSNTSQQTQADDRL